MAIIDRDVARTGVRERRARSQGRLLHRHGRPQRAPPSAGRRGSGLVRLVEIARFEIAYRLRRASTWAFAVMLTVLAVVVMQALSNEPQHLNSPISTATAVALLGMVGMLITAA